MGGVAVVKQNLAFSLRAYGPFPGHELKTALDPSLPDVAGPKNGGPNVGHYYGPTPLPAAPSPYSCGGKKGPCGAVCDDITASQMPILCCSEAGEGGPNVKLLRLPR